MNKLISIIIPIYNKEDMIESLIETCINQSYSNIEIICVNDGSTDNSLFEIEKFIERDKRIKLVDKKNGGVSSARNAGIKISQGDYIYFMDADDKIRKDTIQLLYNTSQDSQADIIIGNFENILETRTFINETNYQSGHVSIINIKDIMFFLFESGIGISVWNKLYKKEIIKEISFNESINNGEDFLFNLEIYAKNPIVYYLNEDTYKYYIHNESITYNIKKNSDYLNLFLKINELKLNYDTNYNLIVNYYSYKMMTSIASNSVKAKQIGLIKDYIKRINKQKVIVEILKNIKKSKSKYNVKLSLKDRFISSLYLILFKIRFYNTLSIILYLIGVLANKKNIHLEND